jgi:hypothetical protein
MVHIKNQVNDDGTVLFSANDGIGAGGISSLLLNVAGNSANIVKVEAADSDVYDGLLKTAVSYAFRRGISMDTPPDLKKPACRSCDSDRMSRHVFVDICGVEYDVEIVDEQLTIDS